MMAAVKKLPKTETGPQLCCKTRAGETYVISQNPITMKFTLWHMTKAGYEKLATGGNPTTLNAKIPW